MPVDTSVFSLTAGSVVTPSDTTTFPDVVRSLWIGGGGNVVVRMVGDKSILPFNGVPAGTLLPIQCDRVMAATTATGILALR
jgi:hypothetical protein